MGLYVVHSRAQALAAATAETLVQVLAGANKRLRLRRFGISFDGVTASAVPVLVDVLRQTDAGTGGAFTPLPLETAEAASEFSALNGFSAEPSASSILWSQYLPAYHGGPFEFVFVGDECPVVAASARLGLRATAPAIVNVTAFLHVEE